MPIAQNIDYLSQIVDPISGATLYQCGTDEVELDLSFDRPSHSYSLPGIDAPYDPYGTEGNPMDIRRVPFKFWQLYDDRHTVGGSPTVPATYRSRRQDFNRAVGQGQQVYLVLTDGDGQQWYGLAKLISYPNRVIMDRKFRSDFDGVFELNPPVFRKLYPASWFFLDDAKLLDDGNFLDTNTLPTIPLTAISQQLTVTNNGDAPESYLTVYLRGPFTGPITVYNTSVTKNGTPLQFTYLGSLGLYQTLAIDFAAGTFRLNGAPAFDPQRIFRAPGQRAWFYLLPGPNILQANVSSAGVFGQLSSVDITNAGSGFPGLPTVAISGGTPSAGAVAHAVISGGAVASVVVDQGGANYLSTPTVTITGGRVGGSAATATAHLSTVVSSVVMGSGGSGYTSAPTPVFGGGGSGATGVATINAAGQVTGVTVTAGGTGYSFPTTVTFTGGGGTGASGGAILTSGVLTSISVGGGGSGYTGLPAIGFSGGSPSVAATAHAVISGAGTIQSIILDTAGVGYGTIPTVTITGGGGTGATAIAHVGGQVLVDARDTRF